MRLHRLELQNFKGFANPPPIEFPEMFNLLVGANGSGKTNILDAAAVALGVLLTDPPHSKLANSKRNIRPSEVRLYPKQVGDRTQFFGAYPVRVKAVGDLGSKTNLEWTALIKTHNNKGSRPQSQDTQREIRRLFYGQDQDSQSLCPVVAYYGAGRAWLPSNEKDRPQQGKSSQDIARRWDAYYDAFTERIRFSDLIAWFRSETLAAGIRGGKMRPGFEAVIKALIGCVPDARDAWYDDDQKDIILAIADQTQPMKNLSAGQRMMLAMVGDLAIRCVTLNAHLLPADELGPEDMPLPRVLAQTPGVVLIDEIDVHLHPTWQRRVASDLKRTFPLTQFICTSHSPQVIGEVKPSEVQLLRPETDPEFMAHPGQCYGMDTNWILNVLMGGDDKNKDVEADLEKIKDLLMEKRYDDATEILQDLRGKVGNSGAIQRAASSIERFKLLGG
jgi:predicted ATP-binding protein involved in virulence